VGKADDTDEETGKCSLLDRRGTGSSISGKIFRDNVGKNPLAEDAVAFEDVDHLPDARDVLRGTGFEPTDPQAKLVTFQGGGFSRFSLNHARSLFSSSASERVMFCHSSCAAV
jgi:hypothetical protein